MCIKPVSKPGPASPLPNDVFRHYYSRWKELASQRISLEREAGTLKTSSNRIAWETLDAIRAEEEECQRALDRVRGENFESAELDDVRVSIVDGNVVNGHRVSRAAGISRTVGELESAYIRVRVGNAPPWHKRGGERDAQCLSGNETDEEAASWAAKTKDQRFPTIFISDILACGNNKIS